MPVDFLKQKKKQKYMLFLAIVIFLAILIILWFGYFRKKEPITAPTPGVSGIVLEEIKINFDVLKNPLLKKLQPFDEILLFEEATGRTNPFEPYY